MRQKPVLLCYYAIFASRASQLQFALNASRIHSSLGYRSLSENRDTGRTGFLQESSSAKLKSRRGPGPALIRAPENPEARNLRRTSREARCRLRYQQGGIIRGALVIISRFCKRSAAAALCNLITTSL